MKFLYLTAVIAVAVACVQAHDISGRIEGGQNALPTDNYVFRFLSVVDHETMVANLSSGVAITENFGLVVAQAIYGFQIWYVSYGSINVDEQVTQEIREFKVHEYDEWTLQNNIAVIKFTIPVDRFLPIATGPPLFGILNVFGFGFSDVENPILPNTLQQIVSMETPSSACIDEYPEFDEDTSICALSPEITRIGDGDQGGAITDVNRVALHGFVSYWGHEGDLLVGVDIQTYRSFIDDVIDALSTQ